MVGAAGRRGGVGVGRWLERAGWFGWGWFGWALVAGRLGVRRLG